MIRAPALAASARTWSTSRFPPFPGAGAIAVKPGQETPVARMGLIHSSDTILQVRRGNKCHDYVGIFLGGLDILRGDFFDLF